MLDIAMPDSVPPKVLLVMLEMPLVSGLPPFVFTALANQFPGVAALGDWTKRALLFGATMLLALGFFAVTHVLTMETVTFAIGALQSVLAVGINGAVFRMGRTQPGNSAT